MKIVLKLCIIESIGSYLGYEIVGGGFFNERDERIFDLGQRGFW